jgi:hypothetical protein
MQLSHIWEADSRWAMQEISCLLWNPKFYRVCQNPTLVSILWQVNSVYILISYFFTIYLYRVLYFCQSLSSHNRFFSLELPNNILYEFLTSHIRATCLISSSLIWSSNNIKECKLWFSLLCSFLRLSFPLSNNLLGTLLDLRLSQCWLWRVLSSVHIGISQKIEIS